MEEFPRAIHRHRCAFDVGSFSRVQGPSCGAMVVGSFFTNTSSGSYKIWHEWFRGSGNKARGIQSRQDLVEWIHTGFLVPRWGAHFSGRTQERLLNLTIAEDARESKSENLCVQLTLAECRHVEAGPFRNRSNAIPTPSTRAGIPDAHPDSCWEVLDSIDVEEVFQHKFPVLQNCPYHVRGRFRQVARHAVEARSQAVMSQDRSGEVRGWKLLVSHSGGSLPGLWQSSSRQNSRNNERLSCTPCSPGRGRTVLATCSGQQQTEIQAQLVGR